MWAIFAMSARGWKPVEAFERVRGLARLSIEVR